VLELSSAIDDEELRRIVDDVASHLVAQGWSLSIQQSDGVSRTIAFHHPVAVRHGLTITNESPTEVRQAIQAAIRHHRDFVLVSSLPESATHLGLLAQLRLYIAGFGWAPDLLHQLLQPLIDADCLTREEAEWLLVAGPAIPHPGTVWKPIPLQHPYLGADSAAE
jgi:hypothetical protein